MLLHRRGWGITVCGSCSVVVLITKRRSSWACIGNPNPEQETIKGTHAALLACVGGLGFVVCAFGGSCSGYCLLMHSSPSRLFVIVNDRGNVPPFEDALTAFITASRNTRNRADVLSP